MQFAVSPAYFSVKYSKQQKIGKAVLVFPIFHSIGSMQAQAFSSSTTGQPRRRMASRSWVASKTGFSPQRSRSSAAAAADAFAAQGALPAGGAGAQLRILIRELPLVACAMGRGVDAKTHLLVTGAMVGCSAVRADHDVVLKGQRLAAALTGTAIIFRNDILL